MELLNNIWNTLSTSNEGIINIIMLIASPIEALLSFLIFKALLDIPSSSKQKLLYISISTLATLIFITLIPSPINTFINIIFTLFLILKIFKQSVIKSFISALCPMIIFALIGTLIINPYLTLFHLTYEQAETIPIFRLIYLFIMYSIILIIVFLIKPSKAYLKLAFLDELDRNSKIIIWSNLILGLITLAVQLTVTIYYTDILPIAITFLSFLSLLAYFIISIYTLTRIMKLSLTTQKLESAESYNKTLHILHDSVRGFKHDFDNIVTTIGGYVKTNDMDGLQKYYIQLEEDCQKVNNLYLLNPEIINNPRYIQFNN